VAHDFNNLLGAIFGSAICCYTIFRLTARCGMT